jgi:hypothetical protein
MGDISKGVANTIYTTNYCSISIATLRNLKSQVLENQSRSRKVCQQLRL